jgi:transposase
MRFEELTDNQWNILLPSIPPHAPTGRPRSNDRSIVNGMLLFPISAYIIETGAYSLFIFG